MPPFLAPAMAWLPEPARIPAAISGSAQLGRATTFAPLNLGVDSKRKNSFTFLRNPPVFAHLPGRKTVQMASLVD